MIEARVKLESVLSKDASFQALSGDQSLRAIEFANF